MLEIPPDAHRLERLVALVDACPYSIHDLSRVQLSSGSMRVPRFNMPFELGLAVSAAKRPGGTHQFRVLEARPHRLQQSLSDMNGYDPYVHFNRIDGMFDAACDMFVGLRPFPVPDDKGFRNVYRSLRVFRQHRYGTKSVYAPSRFAELAVAGRQYVEQFSTS